MVNDLNEIRKTLFLLKEGEFLTMKLESIAHLWKVRKTVGEMRTFGYEIFLSKKNRGDKNGLEWVLSVNKIGDMNAYAKKSNIILIDKSK